MFGDCAEKSTDSIVKVSEPRSRKATFANPTRAAFVRVRFDGCVVTGAVAADWLVEKIGVGTIVVELKGSDVGHAVAQVKSTMQYVKVHAEPKAKIAGLIVCSQYPRIDTRVQRAKLELKKLFKAPLHVTTHAEQLVIEELLSFSS